MDELMNGNYWIYQIVDGGCGIVKAMGEAGAKANVMAAYESHSGIEYDPADIKVRNIRDMGNAFFADRPSVIELGWTIEMN